MFKILGSFLHHQRLSFFAAKVSGVLYDLGVDRRKLPSDPFNSFCDDIFEKAEPHEAASAFFCSNFPTFSKESYTLPIGGYDLIFRASKMIGIWRDKALIPATSAQRMIRELEEVCKMIEREQPALFSDSPKPAQEGKHEVVAWNVMVNATDPDRCWEIASAFRKTSIPGNALTCETSFLMASIVRDAVRSAFPESLKNQAIASAESAYFKTFDDQSKDELPNEMKAVYGNVRLNHVAKAAFAAYGEKGDIFLVTLPIFVHRIKGDPRMAYEVKPLFEESQRAIANALRK